MSTAKTNLKFNLSLSESDRLRFELKIYPWPHSWFAQTPRHRRGKILKDISLNTAPCRKLALPGAAHPRLPPNMSTVLRFVLAKNWGRSLDTSTAHLYCFALCSRERLGTQPGDFHSAVKNVIPEHGLHRISYTFHSFLFPGTAVFGDQGF